MTSGLVMCGLLVALGGRQGVEQAGCRPPVYGWSWCEDSLVL